MANNKEILAQQLKQIIETDKVAASIINAAYEQQKQVEAEAEEQKASILAVAKQKKADMAAQLLAQQEKNELERDAELRQHIAELNNQLCQNAANNKAKWVDEIVERITSYHPNYR